MAEDWQTLLWNADRYVAQGEALEKSELYKGALEQYHLALELIIKASIAKLGGTPKETHDLDRLIATEIKRKKVILTSIKSNRNINSCFSYVKTAWDMHKRYDDSDYDSLDVVDLFRYYERVYKWMKENFVE